MADVSQQYIDNLITFIDNAEDQGAVTNQMVADVLDYLNSHTCDANEAIALLSAALATLQEGLAGKADASATYTREVIDSLLSGKMNKFTALNGIKGFRVITSTDELPVEPDARERELGYLLGTVLYVHVGAGGDTLDGLWQSVELRGQPGVGFGTASSPTPADGTLQIVLTNGDILTIDLNHTHPELLTALAGKQGKLVRSEVIPAGGLLPGVCYDYGATDSVSVTLQTNSDTVADFFVFRFTCLSDACVVTLPSECKMPVGMDMEMAAGRRFEVVIDEDLCVTFNCWD